MAITLKIKIDSNGTQYLEMSKGFARLAANTASDEYKHLQEVRRDYPNAKVITRSIKKDENQDHFKGLSYDYMRDYILRYEPEDTRMTVLKILEKKIIISQCHSKGLRYPKIKKWFLEKYPEVNSALIDADDKTAAEATLVKSGSDISTDKLPLSA